VLKKPKITLQDKAEYITLRIVIALFRAMPTDMAISFMGSLWTGIAPRLKRHQRALQHIALAMPELNEDERERIIGAMWRHLGMCTAETILLDRLWNDKSRFSFSSHEMSAKVLATPQAVLVTLHQGNWEIATAPMTWQGHEVAGVYQRIRNPLVQAYMHRQRLNIYKGGLYVKGKEAAVNMMRHAQTGIVGIVADLRDSNRLTVPFFNMPAPSTPFPAMVALAKDLPIYAGRAVRVGPGRFRIDVQEVAVSRTGDKDQDIKNTTAAIQSQIETWVRDEPEQWMWAHKRWKA